MLEIFRLFPKVFRLVRQEPLLLVPYVAIAFCTTIGANLTSFRLSNWVLVAFEFIGLGWILDNAVKIAVTVFAILIINQKKVPFPTVLIGIRKTYFRVMAATFPAIIPLGFLSFNLQASLSSNTPPTLAQTPWLIGQILAIFVLGLGVNFLPTIAVVADRPLRRLWPETFRFIGQNWVKIIQFFGVLLITILLTFQILVPITESIPVLGKGLFASVIEGGAAGFITLLQLFFVIHLSQQSPKSVKTPSRPEKKQTPRS
jgi:hypothetical protein